MLTTSLCTSNSAAASQWKLLTLFSDLADAALRHAGDGPVRERDAESGQTPWGLAAPQVEYLYTDTHLALLLVLLDHAGDRSTDRYAEALDRLRIWNRWNVAPSFFNGMAVGILGILLRSHGTHLALSRIVAEILSRRAAPSDRVWAARCGNNMVLQQLCVDTILMPLAEGKQPDDQTIGILERAFRSCVSEEGFFFDLPRPDRPEPRQFPYAYILKCLFVLGLACHWKSTPGLRALFEQGIRAVLPFVASDGSFSFAGRTDNSTFASGLAIFCFRAAAAMDIEPETTRRLAAQAEALFRGFPRGEDGCLEVNRYPLPASQLDLVRSRDSYAYRWQYAIAGATYATLSRVLFADGAFSAPARVPRAVPCLAISHDLNLVRVKSGEWDLHIRTGTVIDSEDRRLLGPTILRLERAKRLMVGAIPKMVATDPACVVPWTTSSGLMRHLRLAAYRWQGGLEQFHAETVGFLPIVRRGGSTALPADGERVSLTEDGLTTEHTFIRLPRRGLRPCVAHCARQIGQLLSMPLLAKAVGGIDRTASTCSIRLRRTITWSAQRIAIADELTGLEARDTVVMGVRQLHPLGIEVRGLQPAGDCAAWSSDGPVTLTWYQSSQTGPSCRYELVLTEGRLAPVAHDADRVSS